MGYCKFCQYEDGGEYTEENCLVAPDKTQKFTWELGIGFRPYEESVKKRVTLDLDILYEWDELDRCEVPINYCPVCGRLLNEEGAEAEKKKQQVHNLLQTVNGYHKTLLKKDFVWHSSGISTIQEFEQVLSNLEEEGKIEIEQFKGDTYILPAKEKIDA